MKKFCILFIHLIVAQVIYAESSGVSQDGRFVFAFVDKTNTGTNTYLIIQAIEAGWKKEIRIHGGDKNASFSPDGSVLAYKNRDTLILESMEVNNRELIEGVSEYTVASQINYVTYRSKRGFIVRNLSNKIETILQNVSSVQWDSRGNTLLIRTVEKTQGKDQQGIAWLNVKDGSITKIWSEPNAEITNQVFNSEGNALAFSVKYNNVPIPTAKIWLFKKGDEQGKVLVDDSFAGSETNLRVSEEYIQFAGNSDRLLFYFKERTLPTKNPKYGNVDIWNYTDATIQSIQYSELAKGLSLRIFASVVDINFGKVIRLQGENEKLLGDYSQKLETVTTPINITNYIHANEDYTILFQYPQEVINYNDFFWNDKIRANIYLVSLADGSRKLLEKDLQFYNVGFPLIRISPAGKFVVFYNSEKEGYSLYSIKDSKWETLVSSNQGDWRNYNTGGALFWSYAPRGIFGWLPDDSALLIIDRHSDIWKVNTGPNKKILNITNAMGKKQRMYLSSAFPISANYYSIVLNPESPIFLRSVFGAENSFINPGYYKININHSNVPEILIKPGGKYKITLENYSATKRIFTVVSQNAETPKEYYYTNNFKELNKLSSAQPEQRVGLRKELVTYKTFNGDICRGILYYPSDFDSTKKYPVLLNYYELNSDKYLNWETLPSKNSYLGTGYFEFVPDVFVYTDKGTGNASKVIYNSVVSGVKNISKRHYINSKKIGIRGVSWAGYETYSLLVHSNLFAAAQAGFGKSNLVTEVLSEERSPISQFSMVEHYQTRVGASLWERPDLFLKNSPVFFADRVTTPLLISHNTNDYVCTFANGLQMYKSLRRLGKPVWMLSETDGGDPLYHSHGGPNEINGTTLVRQFFNHYLKDAPAPKWMLDPTPARMKGVEDVTVLDSTGRKPGPGLTMEHELRAPSQVELIKHRTTVNENGRIVDVKPITNRKN